jgi:sucrose-phosphate synthase
MELRFLFSRRIDADRLAMERAFCIITSTHQERMEQYSHPLYQGAVEVNDDPKFSVIPPGVNLEIFNVEGGDVDRVVEAKLRVKLKNPDQPHLLISSRIDEKKNIGNAVAAWVNTPSLTERAGLVICVRGVDNPWEDISSLRPEEQAVLQAILEMIESAGLRDRVDFLNIPSQVELAATYRYFARGNSVFVLPSVYEPFGLAPIEAAACGLACVATKNGGPSEIFEDSSGVLIDPFDVGDIARGLVEALDQRADLSVLGRKRVLAMYTWDKTAAGYLGVIRDGIESGPVVAGPLPELDAGDRIKGYLEMRNP